MTFLRNELIAFEEARQRHDDAIVDMYVEAEEKYKERRDELDVVTPIYHRQPPSQLIQELETKPRRLKAFIAKKGWEEDEETLDKILDECKDIINYAAFLGGLALLLKEDL